ncbi:hypothetical protein GTO87_02945 [Ligilactobacillus saerimneri]|uniref:Uncharacterized protein n=1 Tax=Ligilactobacillus saerimneri TaxID=228229 RepID=A0A7H9EIW4_9LACO|nr:hypothetical protein [Ligilactobacillus saerimneri]QLL77648.1 hypothetical protein GTO87_02945 [Ligilactobacillus saerimneri]
MQRVYEVKVNNIYIGTFEEADGVGLWQALSEEPGAVNVPESRLADWQDLPDDNVRTLLESAKAAGFIDDYDMDLVEG